MMPHNFKSVPIVVICRDRLAPLRELLDWLARAGYGRVLLVDNASTYPPLVDFLSTTNLDVVRLERNIGHLAPWSSEVRSRLDPTRPFVVNDCDVVPDNDCPLDVVEHLSRLLLRHANVDKAGLGLRIDDLPDCYALKEQVIAWESQFWEREVAPGVFEADVDTTFALYRSPSDTHSSSRALRTGVPYVARHLPWYADSAQPTDEQRYYREHADPSVSHWEADRPDDSLRRLLQVRADQVATREIVAKSRNPLLDSWANEPPLVDEPAHMPRTSPGWSAWNAMSPELEFCEFAGVLMRFLQPSLVIDTGVGQGFITRRLAFRLSLDQQLMSFEDDANTRQDLERLPFFAAPNHLLGATPSPTSDDLARADLTVLHSKFPLRVREFDVWIDAARPGAVLLLHDDGNGHERGTPHHLMRSRTEERGVDGVFLQNPRGSFLAIKPDDARLRQELTHERDQRTRAEQELGELRSLRVHRLLSLERRLRRSTRR